MITPKVNLIHTFNTVCDTKIPWISTFETAIPRSDQTTFEYWKCHQTADRFTKKAFRLLCKNNCKAIIAISEATKNIQLKLMEILDIEKRNIISDKLIVLPPLPKKYLSLLKNSKESSVLLVTV